MGLPAGVNASVVGLFKDEEPHDVITEFVGVRSYAYKTLVASEQKKNKGIKKAVIRKHISFGKTRYAKHDQIQSAQRVH